MLNTTTPTRPSALETNARLTLRGIKIHAGLSDDTTAFNATLYLDGRPVAEALNRGDGGPNHFYPKPERRLALDEALAYAKTLPAEPSSTEALPDLAMDLDLLVGLLVEREGERLYRKRAGKRGCLFARPGEARGSYLQLERPYDAGLHARIERDYPGATVYGLDGNPAPALSPP